MLDSIHVRGSAAKDGKPALDPKLELNLLDINIPLVGNSLAIRAGGFMNPPPPAVTNQLIEEMIADGKKYTDYDMQMGAISLRYDPSKALYIGAELAPLQRIVEPVSINQPLIDYLAKIPSAQKPLHELKTYLQTQGYDPEKLIIESIGGTGPVVSGQLEIGKNPGANVRAEIAGLEVKLKYPLDDRDISLACSFALGARVGVKKDVDQTTLHFGSWSFKASQSLKKPLVVPKESESLPSVKQNSSKEKIMSTISLAKPVNAQQFLASYGVTRVVTDQNIISGINGLLTRLDAVQALQQQQLEQANQAKQLQAAQTFFQDLSALGGKLNCKPLVDIALVGNHALAVGQSLVAIQKQFPALQALGGISGLFNGATSALTTLQPYITVASSVVQIGMSLFGRRRNKSSGSAQISQALQQIMQHVGVLRKEMHERFNVVDQKLNLLSRQIDDVYFNLKAVVEFNADRVINRVDSHYLALGENVTTTRNYLSELITETTLADYERYLHQISEHLVGEKQDATKLKSIRREFEKLWLTTNETRRQSLARSAALNGENSVILNSNSDDKNFFRNGPGSVMGMLGYFALYAQNKLGVTGLDHVAGLPNVGLWSYGVLYGLAARYLEAQAQNQPVAVDEFIRPELEIANNTLGFLSALVAKRVEIFQKIITRHQNALNNIEQKIIGAMAAQLINNREVFSLKDARALLPINSINFSGRIVCGDSVITAPRRIKSIALSLIGQVEGKINLALPTVLAIKLDLFQLSGSFQMDRTAAYFHSAPENRRYHYVWHSTGSINANLSINAGGVSVIGVSAAKDSVDQLPSGDGRPWRDRYGANLDSVIATHHAEARTENNMSHQAILAVASATGSSNAIDLSQNNNAVALATKIFQAIKDGKLEKLVGKLLAEKCQSIYEAAYKNVEVNVVTIQESLDELVVASNLVDAYGRLIGYPTAQIKSLQQIMPTDLTALTNTPSLFISTRGEVEQKLRALNDYSLPLYSDVRSLISGVHSAITDFSNIVELQKAYESLRKQWEQDDKILAEQTTQMQKLQSIIANSKAVNVDYTATTNALINYQDQVARLKQKLEADFDLLQQMRSYLLAMDVNVSEPVRGVIGSELVVDQELHRDAALARMNDRWQDSEQDMGFSMSNAMDLITKTVAVISAYEGGAEAVNIVVGRTGTGKSTLINFINRTDYKKELVADNVVLVRQGGAKEIAKTGDTPESVTEFPAIYRCEAGVFVDMPGFEDTKGIEYDMRTGVSTALIANKCNSVRSLLVVFQHADIFNARNTNVLGTLSKVAAMVSHNPALIGNIQIIVTMPDEERIRLSGSRELCESGIFNRLRQFCSDGVRNPEASFLGRSARVMLGNLGRNLSRDQVLFVQATNPADRERLQDRLSNLTPRLPTEFNFTNYHNKVYLMQRFIKKVRDYRDQLSVDSQNILSALCQHWQNRFAVRPAAVLDFSASSNAEHKELVSALLTSSNQSHAELMRVMQEWKNLLAPYANRNAGIVGDEDSVVSQMIDILHEIAVNAEFFGRLEFLSTLVQTPENGVPQAQALARFGLCAVDVRDVVIGVQAPNAFAVPGALKKPEQSSR